MFIDYFLAGVFASGLTLFVDRLIDAKFGVPPVSNFYVDMYRSTDDLNDVIKSCIDIRDDDDKDKYQKGTSDEQV